MKTEDAARLAAAMASEEQGYLAYFTAFDAPDSLLKQCKEARQDAFFTLIEGDQAIGFFCLRGLDAGFLRPEFRGIHRKCDAGPGCRAFRAEAGTKLVQRTQDRRHDAESCASEHPGTGNLPGGWLQRYRKMSR